MIEDALLGGSRGDDAIAAEREEWGHHAHHREIFDALRDGIVLYDAPSGTMLEVNAGACALFGHGEREMLARRFWELSVQEEGYDQERASRHEREALATGKATFEWRLRRADGTPFWSEVRLVRSAGARHLVALVRDIGDLKAALESSRLAEERYRALVRNLPKSAILLCDHELRLVLVDGPEVSASGFSKERLEGRTIHEALPADFVRLVEPNMRRVLQGESFSAEIPFGDRWYMYNYVPIRDDSGTRVLYGMVLAVNITKRRRAEDALRRSRELFARIFRTFPDAMAVTRAEDGLIVQINPGFERVFGWTQSEAVGKTTIELGMWVEPEERHRIVEQALSEETPEYAERSVRRKDGEIIVGIVSLRPIELEGGSSFLFIFRDITDRKKSELERERFIAELRKRNAEMEEFTHTVSHDLRSPLVTIHGFVGMIERDLAAGDTARVRADLARVGSAANRMTRLLGDLLELSQVGRVTQPMEWTPLEEIVRDALSPLSAQVAERKVHVEVAPDMPRVYGDRARLVEAVQNLLENALKYMGGEGEPTVQIGVRPDPEYVVCFVRDNGIGVESRYSERIFGLFEKLDPKTEGTGVGLSLVKRILELHGGNVWVESDGARGSTFVFRLPRTPAGIRRVLEKGSNFDERRDR